MEEAREEKALKNDSEPNFESLVTRYQQSVLNTCFGFLHNREEAEDVTQEVFMEVYRSMDAFRGEAKISTWLYRIAVSKSLDAIRRKKRQKRFGSLTRVFGFNPDHETVNLTPEENPHNTLEEAERARILKNAVDALKQNQKIAITLSKYEGFSNKEIAAIMEISVPAVEALIHRAKKNLRKILSAYYERRL